MSMLIVFFVLLFRVWTWVVFLHLISVEFKIRQHQRQPTSGVKTIVKKMMEQMAP